LLEAVGRVANPEATARSIGHLDGMSVVDDVERNGVVVKGQSGQVGLFRTADVDRRLRVPRGAVSKPGVEFAPI